MTGEGGRALAVACAVGVALLACGTGDADLARWSGTVDTLPGGVVRVSSPASGSWEPGMGWHLEEDLTIGRADGEGPDVFGTINDIEVDGRGRMWVLDGNAGEVRLFDAQGGYVRTLGRAGDGPGEMRFPGRLTLVDDALWVADGGARRYTVFDTAGTLRATYRFPGFTFGGGARIRADGVWDVEPRRTEGGPSRRRLGHWVPQDGELVLVDSFPTPASPEPEVFTATVESNGRSMVMAYPIPYLQQPALYLRRSGGWTFVPGGGDYRILRLDRSGDTARIIRREWEPVPLSETARAEALGRFPASARAEVEDRVPASYPPFDRLLEGSDGTLWITRTIDPDGERGIDVFDADGRYLGAVQTSLDARRLTLYRVDPDNAYGVWRDELDIPRAVRLRIVKP